MTDGEVGEEDADMQSVELVSTLNLKPQPPPPARVTGRRHRYAGVAVVIASSPIHQCEVSVAMTACRHLRRSAIFVIISPTRSRWHPALIHGGAM